MGPLFFSQASWALPAPQQAVALRAGTHEKYDRLAFDLGAKTPYRLLRDGDDITLSFETAAPLEARKLPQLKRLASLSLSSTTEHGQPVQLVKFSIDPQARTHAFVSGNTIAVDIIGEEAPTPQRENKGQENPTEPTQKAETPAPLPTTDATPTPAPPPTPTPAPSPEPSPTATPRPTPTNTPAALKESADLGSLFSRTTSKSQPPQIDTAHAIGPTKPVEIQDRAEIVASFDPKTPTGVVVFSRGDQITFLFDRKLAIPPETLTAGAPLKIRITPIDLPRNNGFRFAAPQGVHLFATREGTAWVLRMSKQMGDPSLPTTLVSQPDFALGARLVLPSATPLEPIAYTDPVLGDDLILIPLQDSQGNRAQRHLADMDILPSAQGLVIRPAHEKLSVRKVTDGLEITAEGGLRLSPSDDTGIASTQGRIKGEKSLFDIAGWRGKKNEPFQERLQRQTQAITESQPKDRLLARLDLARMYFAYGMGEEALSLLRMLEKQEPDLSTHPDYVALRGAASILTHNVAEGIQDLSIPRLAPLREADLWKAVAYAEMRDWPHAYERFRQTQDILKHYPEPFLTNFSLLAIESALAQDKDKDAAAWIEALDKDISSSEREPALAYLKGALASKQGQADKAEALWREAAKGKDRLAKIRAELALVDLAVATKSLTPAQAAQRLEGLRYAWRGDDLELDILYRLGGFYLDAKNFREGFQVMGQALRLYPSAPMTPIVRAQMTQAYRDLFLSDAAEDLSPIEALAIYQDFAYLRSREDSQLIGKKLVERLVSIDLLDQAAAILETQVQAAGKSEDRAQIGARLAGIYLLDHRAEKAITALQKSGPRDGEPALSPATTTQRTVLQSRVLSEQKKYDEALALLSGPVAEDRAAKLLRADILTRAGRWDQAAQALLDTVAQPGEKIDTPQAEALVNAAVAYALAGNSDSLNRLAKDYGKPMEATPQGDMFRVLTQTDRTLQVADLQAASARIAEADMFRRVLDSYRTKETSEKESGK